MEGIVTSDISAGIGADINNRRGWPVVCLCYKYLGAAAEGGA